ncbi:MAG: sigma-70 family RNA polymerase sigma factor [Clostridiales bacterium]|nr:sigma-70 family RNA polymerase sigma factor [Clostridiales bacterium]
MARGKADPQRFMELVAPLERKVYFTCLHLMTNREDAEDCAQDALQKAFERFHTFKGQSQFSTWLYTLTTRVCMDALRKRREVYSLDLMREEGFEVSSTEAEMYLQLEEKERRAMLREGIKQLPPDFRAALVLVDLQGMPYAEAAQALHVPEGTVKSRVNRARKALYNILMENRELFMGDQRLNDERRKSHDL